MRPSLYAHPTLSSGTRCAAEDDLCRRLHTLEPKLPIAPDWTAGINNTCLLQDGHAGNVCLPSIHILGGWHSFVNSALSPLLSAHPSLMLKGRAGGACFEDWEDNEAQARSAPSFALPRPPSPSLALLLPNQFNHIHRRGRGSAVGVLVQRASAGFWCSNAST